MKKIIDGKRYDTNTAKEIVSASSSVSRSDFHWWRETLYRKQTGEFFLHGEGGPASRYSRSVGLNEWSGGERIMPLSFSEAQQWAEDHLDGDEYERIFGEVSEDGAKKTVAFSLSLWAIDKIAAIAAEKEISKSEVIEQLLK